MIHSGPDLILAGYTTGSFPGHVGTGGRDAFVARLTDDDVLQ